MSKSKTSTAELIAIYRLEFYKKKKNWKLSEDKKKSLKTNSSTDGDNNSTTKTPDAVLNRTYSIDEQVNKEPSLNEAFFETASDDNNTVQIEPEPPVNCINENDTTKILEQNAEENTVDLGGDHNRSKIWIDSLPPATNWTREISHQYGSELIGDQWWFPDVVPYSYRTQDMTHKQELDQEAKSDNSLESISEFMRGAHCAPHSSEVDLQDAETCEYLSPDDLATQSTKQLHARVMKHSTALQGLVSELKVRELMQPRTCISLENYRKYAQSYNDLSSVYSEQDTALYAMNYVDIPLNLRNKFHLSCDSFIKGSEGEVGRGRGRGRLRDNLLGIGRGRAWI